MISGNKLETRLVSRFEHTDGLVPSDVKGAWLETGPKSFFKT